MEINKILSEREAYYKQIFLLFEMIKCLKFRECAFLTIKGYEPKKAFRYMWASNIDYLKSHLNWVGFTKHPFNVYCSVATLKKNVPVFTYNLKERKNDENYKEFNENFLNYIEGYDLFFDFDGKDNFEKCYQDAKRFKQILDDYKLPYFVQNSSKRGFHFVILDDFMPKNEIRGVLEQLNILIRVIKRDYGFETLDPTIIDPKRLRKCLIGDMPLIIKDKNIIEIVTFNELANKFFLHKRENIKKLDNIKVLSMNIKKKKLEWDKIRYLIRRNNMQGARKIIRKIETDNGFFTETTKDHKILKWNYKNDFEFKKQINKDDVLVSPKITLNGNIKRVDILPFILEKRNEYCFRCKLNLTKKQINNYIKKANLGWLTSRNIRKVNLITIQDILALEIPLNNITGFSIDNQKILNRYIKIDKNLMQLLGFFISEGCLCNRKKGIDRMGFAITIGKEYEREVCECIKGLGFKPYVYKDNRKSMLNIRKITANHRLLGLILSDFFKCGSNCYEKQIPFIVWNVNKRLQMEFLKCAIAGDGNISKKRISYFTISKKLANDMIILLKSLNFSPNLKKGKLFTISFNINKNLNNKYNIFNAILLENKKLHKGYKMFPSCFFRNSFKNIELNNKQKFIQLSKGKRMNNKFALNFLNFIENNKKKRWGNKWVKYNFIKKLLETPLQYSLVKNISLRKRRKKEYVYDINTEKNHNFISGIGGLVHHNCSYSYSCDGCIVLPLTDAQFLNFTPEMVSYNKVMSSLRLKERGLLIRNHGLSLDELKQNVIKFLQHHKE